MLKRRIIPCLDVRNGRVVKGVRFANLRDVGDPAQRAARYDEDGADELVLLDVSATDESRSATLDTIEAVRANLSVPLTVGGGVRAVDDAEALLCAGADKISVNTAAVRRPELVSDIADRFGAQCCVVAIDAARSNGSWQVVTNAGRLRHAIDVLDWTREVVARGAGEILLTSWDRDGSQIGYDLDLLAAVSGVAGVPVIASGGAATVQHIKEAFDAGAHAALAASIFHDAQTAVREVKRELAQLGVEVRL